MRGGIRRPIIRSGIILPNAALILAGGLVAHAQETPQPSKATFSVDAGVVKVLLTVRDKRGDVVKDPTMEDFTLSEDGRKQTIQNFSRETDLPLTAGFIADTTPSESNRLDEEKSASRVFPDQMLRPGGDQAFVFQFGYQIDVRKHGMAVCGRDGRKSAGPPESRRLSGWAGRQRYWFFIQRFIFPGY